MVAGRGKGIGKSGEDALAIVVDGPAFPVDRRMRGRNPGSKYLGQDLVPQANPQNRDPTAKLKKSGAGDPAPPRPSRTRRDDEVIRGELLQTRDPDRIVSSGMRLKSGGLAGEARCST